MPPKIVTSFVSDNVVMAAHRPSAQEVRELMSEMHNRKSPTGEASETSTAAFSSPQLMTRQRATSSSSAQAPIPNNYLMPGSPGL